MKASKRNACLLQQVDADAQTIGQNRMNTRRTFVGALLFLIPCVARADVGTPLVWATGFHMLFGNALLGVFEGWLLGKVFDLRQKRCMGLLILANYFSAWLGMFIVDALRASQAVDIYNALQMSLALIFVTYLLTLFLEWPFVAFCFRRTPQWFAKSIKGSLLVQTVSYLLLFGGFWLVSGKTLYTAMRVVPSTELSLGAGVQVFFIGDVDGDVYRISNRGRPTKIWNLKSTNVSDFLCFQKSKQDTNWWNLVAVMDRRRGKEEGMVILRNALWKPSDDVWLTQQYWGWGSAPRVGTATNSPWHFQWAHWNDLGMWGRNEKTGARLQVAFGTPVMGWPVWRAIQLPGNNVLFQLGKDQLCLLDIESKRIALVAHGYGPVAVTDDELSNQTVVGALPPADPHR
jgi:hypothetical protein